MIQVFMNLDDLSLLSQKSSSVSEVLKAISHESRLMAVCYIGQGEKSVQELESYLKTSQSNISQHLARLRTLGILKTRKEGNQVFYSLNDEKTGKLVEAIQQIFCS